MSPRLNRDLALRIFGESNCNVAETYRRLTAPPYNVRTTYLTVRRVIKGTQTKAAESKTLSRFSHAPSISRPSRILSADLPAFKEKRTIYPSTVRLPLGDRVLKSGSNAAKIGGVVTKGRWSGFPVYTITLEERATCPTACRHWRSCFGNQMQFAHRFKHGLPLEVQLQAEVSTLQVAHPEGFVIRVHVLGDFYSVGYVALWRMMLAHNPALHVFGYTARIERNDPIAVAIWNLVMENWDRFAIRFSNAPIDECATVTIEHPIQAPPDAIVCPQQTGATESCSTCGFCWESRKRVAFIQH